MTTAAPAPGTDSTADCTPAPAALPIARTEAERLARLLKAVADPTRLQILRLVQNAPAGEVCVCDLTDTLGLRQPTVSHHLKTMTDAGILTREGRGTWAWYTVDQHGLDAIRDILS
ncbi:metalloregulator ArsR/SmtB family transcription factor [Kitasatospora cineracea]|uniref:ArsR/SmtB family transcription factor n=1 Tax=Kitasatospora cineracea TaxID=88074 RepID=UPI00342182DC